MRISNIQAQKTPNYIYKQNTLNKQSTSASIALHKGLTSHDLPTESIKANFLPAFGRFKKVKDVTLTNKKTGQPVNAVMKKDEYSDKGAVYKIYIKNREAGLMDLGYDMAFPEGDFVLTEPTNVIPQVKRLYSLLGDEYSGIGTEFIKQAIEESRAHGMNGCLWLNATKGFARTITKHRRDESPIPFYYKMGFQSPNKKMDEYIQQCLAKKKHNALPAHAILLLTSKDAQRQYK